MARIGRSKSDVGLDNKHSLQYYRRGMMDVLTRRLFPSSSPLFPPPQFDSSRSKRFYEISTGSRTRFHSQSFEILRFFINRNSVSTSLHLRFEIEPSDLWDGISSRSIVKGEGRDSSLCFSYSFLPLSLPFFFSPRPIQQTRTRYAKRITMAPLSSPRIITNRDGNGVSIS